MQSGSPRSSTRRQTCLVCPLDSLKIIERITVLLPETISSKLMSCLSVSFVWPRCRHDDDLNEVAAWRVSLAASLRPDDELVKVRLPLHAPQPGRGLHDGVTASPASCRPRPVDAMRAALPGHRGSSLWASMCLRPSAMRVLCPPPSHCSGALNVFLSSSSCSSSSVNEGGVKQVPNYCPDPGETENGKRVGSNFR